MKIINVYLQQSYFNVALERSIPSAWVAEMDDGSSQPFADPGDFESKEEAANFAVQCFNGAA